MEIREALDTDLDDVLLVERLAFGGEAEAELVKNLMRDRSAKPLLSLLALQNEQPVGHILFTKAHLTTDANIAIAILAPLAVVPDAQKQGIGGKLVQRGLELLSQAGFDLIFVLGHPEYYPRYGFKPAGNLGFEATYPILEKNADAWMVQELRPGAIASFSGKVICCDGLNKPEYWR
ncbi:MULTISPECIES: N-acetyltransferase [Spirulina sp. CCY15215]|uniref:GNAT family N-acetyltransferase n=1 Tax=Spirulina sp. CCY15215 TaxID=2767591 RepID=UPI00195292F8|nr:N-acetyltransferase [Spirulina major]